MALLEGKVVVITDLSPYALILPSFFLDYFHTVDDYYQKIVILLLFESFVLLLSLLRYFYQLFILPLQLEIMIWCLTDSY